VWALPNGVISAVEERVGGIRRVAALERGGEGQTWTTVQQWAEEKRQAGGVELRLQDLR
jgi:hypothetical protein